MAPSIVFTVGCLWSAAAESKREGACHSSTGAVVGIPSGSIGTDACRARCGKYSSCWAFEIQQQSTCTIYFNEIVTTHSDASTRAASTWCHIVKGAAAVDDVGQDESDQAEPLPDVEGNDDTPSPAKPDLRCWYQLDKCFSEVDSDGCKELQWAKSRTLTRGWSVCKSLETAASAEVELCVGAEKEVSSGMFAATYQVSGCASAGLQTAVGEDVCTDGASGGEASEAETFHLPGIAGKTTVGCAVGTQVTVNDNGKKADFVRYDSYEIRLDKCPEPTCAYHPAQQPAMTCDRYDCRDTSLKRVKDPEITFCNLQCSDSDCCERPMGLGSNSKQPTGSTTGFSEHDTFASSAMLAGMYQPIAGFVMSLFWKFY